MGGKDVGLRNSVFHAFQHAKNDIERMNIRLMLLETENKRLLNEVFFLKNNNSSEKFQESSESQEILSIETLRLELRKIVSEELKAMNTKAAARVSAETETEKLPIEQKKVVSEDKLKEDILRNYDRNRKDIVKQQIISETEKGTYSKLQLRDIVVDQKKYCSKASFYRYLDELELTGRVRYQRQKNQTVIIPEITQ